MESTDGGERRRGLWRAGAAAGATLVAVYMLNLAGNVLVANRAREQEDRLATDVAALEAQVTALSAALATATTDAAVEAWARSARQWAQPGDHVIEPHAGPAPAATGAPVAPGGGPWWQRLGEWLRPAPSPSPTASP